MDAKSAWDSGITLERALFRHGETETVDAYRRISKHQPLLMMAGALNEQIEKRAFDSEKMRTAQKLNKDTIDLRLALEAQVAARLTNGGLVGCGYALPRSPDDGPIEIPADVWGGKINWQKSEVKGNGLEFAAVRVVETQSDRPSSEIATNVTQNPPSTRPPGRPGVATFIEEAYQALREADAIDYDAPRARIYEPIRGFLMKKYPGNKARWQRLSDKTVASHTKDLFDADRKKPCLSA